MAITYAGARVSRRLSITEPSIAFWRHSLGAVLKRNKGSTPVFLSVRDQQGKQVKVKLKLGDSFQVNAANLRAEDLEMILGPGSVVFTR